MGMINNKEYDILLSVLSILKSRGTENQVKIHYSAGDARVIDVLSGTITGFSNKCVYLRQSSDKNSKLPISNIVKVVDVSNCIKCDTSLSVNIDSKLVGQAQDALKQIANNLTEYEDTVRKALLGEYVELVLKDRSQYSKLASSNNNEMTNLVVRSKKFVGTVLGLCIDDITPNKDGQSMSIKDVNFALVIEVNVKDEISMIIANTAEFDVYKADICLMSQD